MSENDNEDRILTLKKAKELSKLLIYYADLFIDDDLEFHHICAIPEFNFSEMMMEIYDELKKQNNTRLPYKKST